MVDSYVAQSSDADGKLPTDIRVGIAGDDVTILYSDANTFFPLTRNVECTLT
jgi:hypothetical protein